MEMKILFKQPYRVIDETESSRQIYHSPTSIVRGSNWGSKYKRGFTRTLYNQTLEKMECKCTDMMECPRCQLVRMREHNDNGEFDKIYENIQD